MTILLTSKTTKTPGPDTRMNCPRCGPDMPAHTYRQVEWMGIFVLPLLPQRETHVECARCGASRLTRLPLEKLAEFPPGELDRHLHEMALVWSCNDTSPQRRPWLVP